jgi:hypothetical protein
LAAPPAAAPGVLAVLSAGVALGPLAALGMLATL